MMPSRVTWLYTADLDGIEPFGFADGISQPKVDWEQQRNMLKGQIDYGNVVALGEFLLGYRNEYGKYTDRPLIDPMPPPQTCSTRKTRRKERYRT